MAARNNNNNSGMTSPRDPLEGHDEVDFILTATHNNNNDYDDLSVASGAIISAKATAAATVTPNNEPNVTSNNNSLKKSKERRTLFNFGSKKSSTSSKSQSVATGAESAVAVAVAVAPSRGSLLLPPTPPVPIGTPPRQHKFVKSSSIARLLGNTYNARKFERQEQKRLANEASGKFHTFNGRQRGAGPYLERFKRMSKEDGDIAGSDETVQVTNVMTLTTDSRDLQYGSRQEHVGRSEDQLSAKAMRTLTRGLGKLWWKRTHSVDISTPDPEYKVSYLGNVLTGWAKGEGCVEKQLNTLWRNYTQHTKPDVIMRVKVCASGLKATTRQHGLTEYWANRITYCCAPKNYPRVFCWIYRHEGRKLKHELRCHAVLCSKEKIAQDICETLKDNLESALREFKREKILKQNARLSLANAVYDNPSLPRRKIMLSVGGNNYRPPLERSKSAPKLMAIEEAIGEEEGDEIEDTNEPEMKPCCQRDSLYPAMTLGRRRCRRGHSIRRTGKIPVAATCCSHQTESTLEPEKQPGSTVSTASGNDGSDSDEFELKFDTTLSTELLPYFDMQLHKNSSQSLGSLSELQVESVELEEVDEVEVEIEAEDGDEEEPLSLLPTINSDPSADPEADYDSEHVVHLRRNGVCSDGEEDYLDDADDHYFRQAAMLTMLHRSSMRKRNSDQASLQYRHQAQSSISSNASSSTTASGTAMQGVGGGAGTQQCLASPDSDEGSISSGCETASTVTNANQEEYNKSQSNNVQHQVLEQILIYQRLEESMRRQQLRHNSDATNYSSSSSITLKLNSSSSPADSLSGLEVSDPQKPVDAGAVSDDDSECSDESGYVEFQEKERVQASADGIVGVVAPVKPQLPPKPAPRRSLNGASAKGIGIGMGITTGTGTGTGTGTPV
ncbi:uncharacterized protein LOC117782533 isoform X2 [Drosophila innubila]|uniref:uncharacterized protein LOC117782533 isoform X2 n=1 Tax=Drosophila innubila TaxID=198719 RepID=UPI00148E667F|nr:uncharacterized protein LOC117782533 isoform X2 [Drosophila innubila]